MSQIYISIKEHQDLVANLTPNESFLYSTIKGMVLESPPAEEFKNTALAKRLDLKEPALAKLKSSLKKKGYLIITFGKNSDGVLTAEVHLGKDQVELYNLGLNVEITSAKAYRELIKLFPINDTSLTIDARKELVRQANEHYLTTTK